MKKNQSLVSAIAMAVLTFLIIGALFSRLEATGANLFVIGCISGVCFLRAYLYYENYKQQS